ncbi:Uncharacterized protein ANAPHAGO_00396 [Anaplasma phagocytophilum]|uniref:Uncharacterized protein n=1 Tax=Anaplasma phagocytophilum TaxID=948 RepID=A0A098EFE0_ANAPH|nr:Uncharacterized protein ANAPHAGO_00396 [Anaplasma phagocytophilum]
MQGWQLEALLLHFLFPWQGGENFRVWFA